MEHGETPDASFLWGNKLMKDSMGKSRHIQWKKMFHKTYFMIFHVTNSENPNDSLDPFVSTNELVLLEAK